MKILFSCLLAFSALFGTVQVVAQGTATVLVEKHYGNFAYLSGGVGEEELADIRSRERDFNLKLLFAERGGAYLGDVDVALTNAAGETVFAVQALGPYVLLRLPSGSYQIRATMNGQVQQGRLSVPAKGRQETVLRW